MTSRDRGAAHAPTPFSDAAILDCQAHPYSAELAARMEWPRWSKRMTKPSWTLLSKLAPTDRVNNRDLRFRMKLETSLR